MTQIVDNDREEDWQVIEDAAQRRRVQNRINQRASRLRKTQGGNVDLVIKHWSLKRSQRRIPPVSHQKDSQTDADDRYDKPNYTVEVNNEDRAFLDRLEQMESPRDCLSPEELIRRRRLRCQIVTPSISADRLLTLIYLNVFRGLSWNIQILGLDAELMCVDDYPSPFLPCSPTASSSITKLPAGLRPTSLQESIDHHPYIDIFPCPQMRNNIIQISLNDEEEERLCVDLMGLSGGISEEERPVGGENRVGVTVWGDPWDIRNWEISSYMVDKWPQMFIGCLELQTATNRRRVARGWKALYFA